MRRLALPLLFLLGVSLAAIATLFGSAPTAPAVAQTICPQNSTPGFTAGGSVFGRLAAQWNQYFGAKVDVNNGILCNPTVVGARTSFPLTCSGLDDGGTACPANVGVAGHTLPFLDGDNAFSGTNVFNTVRGTVRTVSGTTDTLTAADCGRGVSYTSGTDVTVTTFANAAPTATQICTIGLVQKGAGLILLVDGAGATHLSAGSCTKSFGQGALVSLLVTGDAPSEWVWGGQCAP